LIVIVIAMVLAGFAVGCSSSDDSDRTARPIDQILDGPIVVVPDTTGTRATVEVTTSIPLACAVVYGLDGAFGSVAVDDDMAGGAHEDHSPLLAGLIPDTEYTYVLQGSAATGAFYRSEVLTFRTPVAAPAATAGRNVAPAGTVLGASSSFSERFDATLAIDGDTATEWSSDGDGDDAWIEIELDAITAVDGFALRSREMSDGTAIIETYTVTVDGGTALGPFSANDEDSAVDPPVSGKVFRFEAGSTTGGNTGATEIEILAAE
jgi:hypothetical protein